MKVDWKQSAVHSLIKLDLWREENGWPAIAEHNEVIEIYLVRHPYQKSLL